MNQKEEFYKKIEILENVLKGDEESKKKLSQLIKENPNIIDERVNKTIINKIK